MIYLPKIYGTCNGAMNAINIANNIYLKESKKKKPKKIFLYKEILHNKHVIKEFESKGINTIDSIDSLSNDSILIIRAHGEPKSLFDELENRKIEYYDATCIKVKKIHDTVYKKSKEGYTILIIGSKSHPETLGTLGWTNNKGVIIESIDDVKSIKLSNNKILVVSQTTISINSFNEITSKLKEMYPNIEIINTICGAQKAIQESSISLAKDMNIMLVIGGKNSSNTKELFNKCNNVCESFHFSEIKDFYNFIISSDKINNKSKIGLTAGASTPANQIENYKYLLEFILFYKEMKSLFISGITDINNSFVNKSDNTYVKDVINKFTSINKDGKYIRATLIALGYKLGSKQFNKDFIPLALAYETFQTSILIHDDIIDNAIVRRGKDTIPHMYNKEFKVKKETKDYLITKNNVSNSLGICTGDLGFYLANKIIIDNYKNKKNLSEILSYYNDIVIKTIKGEIIDIIIPFKEKYKLSHTKESDILEMYHLKTSWYTIIGPFILGYLLSNNNSHIKELENIINSIGIAFQIKDDIIGIFNNQSDIGKSNQSDINEYKQTLLYTYTVNSKYKSKLLKYYGKQDLKEEELLVVRDIFTKSGALEYATNKMNSLFNESEFKIKEVDFITSDVKNILLGLINFLKIF